MGCKAWKGARAGFEILPLILLRGSSPRHPTSVRIVERIIVLQSPIRWAARQRTRLLPRFDPRRGTMRYVLYLLLVMAAAMAVHGVVAENFPDAVVWLFGVVVVALLIKVEKYERDDE